MTSSSFQVIDAKSYFNIMVKPQYEQFLAQNSCVKSALLSTMLTYHMYEWAHPKEKFSIERFEKRYPEQKELANLFEMARDITNGLKHFKVKPTTTRNQRGFSSAFSNAFARPLIIVSPSGEEISVDQFLEKMVMFWQRNIEKVA
ncbi:TPA: hypothetical protein PX765_003374 [Vibrio cholerae]|uniref:hypothetical protein n=1 Tax=Vibrio cholerae TaxID=666 RepID=UPI00163B720C|nr:hypothetical protein [Vibrio cholerae]HDI3204287.1 hypothetical protein [Vibrio cholerae]HDL9491479.1 hypothetical protein [Vibrio cholerae]